MLLITIIIYVFYTSHCNIPVRSMSMMPGGRGGKLLGPRFCNILPHNIKYSCAYQTILDGTRKEKGTGVLYEGSHDVGTPTLEHVMGTLQSTCQSSVLLTRLLVVRVMTVSLTGKVQVTGLRTCKYGREFVIWIRL